MSTKSSFAGGFNQATFLDAIKNTMLMGMPEDPGAQLVFVWKRDREYSPDDPAGNPYDWSSTPISDEPGNPDLDDDGNEQTLTVEYALEFAARPAGSVATTIGEIDTSRAIVTLMDAEYQKVQTADYALIDGARYSIKFDAPPVGLFGVTVWTLYLEAVDE